MRKDLPESDVHPSPQSRGADLASKGCDIPKGERLCGHLAGLLLVGFGGGWVGFAGLCRLAKETKLPEVVFRSIEIFGNGPIPPRMCLSRQAD